MTLFYMPYACSLAPHILTRELNLPVELKLVPKGDKSELLKFNPKGHVPTLVKDDGKPLTENNVILQYLCDLKPDSGWLPKFGTQERYQAMEWLNYVATDLHKTMGALFKYKGKMSDADLEIVREGVRTELKFLNDHFGKNQFLLGQKISAPDIYAFVVLNWGQWVNVDVTPFKNVTSFMERVQNRPASQAALAAEAPKH